MRIGTNIKNVRQLPTGFCSLIVRQECSQEAVTLTRLGHHCVSRFLGELGILRLTAAPAERDCCYIFSLICLLDAVKTSFAIKSLPCVQNRAPALHCAPLNRNTFCVHLGGSHLRRLLCGNYYVLPGTDDGLFQRFNLRLPRAGY